LLKVALDYSEVTEMILLIITVVISLFAGYCIGYARGAEANVELFLFDEEQYQRDIDEKLKYTK